MKTKKIYQGHRFDVQQLTCECRGKTIEREAVIHPGAVAILPLLDKTQLILIRNMRFVVGKTLWEIPAGTLEPNESPLETAKREIIEETGYHAEKMEPLLSFYTTPGFCNEIMHAFVAKELTYVGQKLEDTEEINVEIVSLSKALQMIQEGAIVDGKTITTLLYYHNFQR